MFGPWVGSTRNFRAFGANARKCASAAKCLSPAKRAKCSGAFCGLRGGTRVGCVCGGVVARVAMQCAPCVVWLAAERGGKNVLDTLALSSHAARGEAGTGFVPGCLLAQDTIDMRYARFIFENRREHAKSRRGRERAKCLGPANPYYPPMYSRYWNVWKSKRRRQLRSERAETESISRPSPFYRLHHRRHRKITH